MELWIRSQNKEMLILIKGKIEIDFIPSFDVSSYYFGLKYNNDILGIYEGKERALEVLDEIQNKLKPQSIIKDNGKIIGSFEDTIIREGATYELKELSTYVYEMPKE